jgi:ABC-2 type transport system ATP-binding protein
MLKVSKISKKFRDQKALDELSFNFEGPGVTGVLGLNGAGKSTLMKIIVSNLNSDGGEVSLNGRKDPLYLKSNIGYLSERNPLYEEMYPMAYFRFHASARNITQDRIDQVIDLIGLTPEVLSKKIKALSKGFRQRVGLGIAILHEPDLLILDEPTSGLDPKQLIEIRKIIRVYGQSHKVLFSSHIMQEVEEICDRIIFIRKGTLVGDYTMNDLREKEGKSLDQIFLDHN